MTPLRDKTHGRIYRIVYKGAKSQPKPTLDHADAKELVAALSNENMWRRMTAQRLLVERGKTDVLPQLAAIVKASKGGPAAIHALWTMDGLGAFESAKGEAFEAAKAGLANADPGVRRAAIAVLPRTAEAAKALLEAKSADDADATVRLEALLALSEMPASKQAAEVVSKSVLDPKNAGDQWIPSAMIAAAARNDLDFLLIAATAQPSKEVEANLHSYDPRCRRSARAKRAGRRGRQASLGAEVGAAGRDGTNPRRFGRGLALRS